ncbi:MAG: hypothetical protein AB1540_13680 [Bdellovibrionota bacterium]
MITKKIELLILFSPILIRPTSATADITKPKNVGQRVFSAKNYFKVPDGTSVSPFLNSKDSLSDLPFDLLNGFSIAAGLVEANSKSKIHLMPHVLQVTYVTKGKLNCKMKEPSENSPKEYSLEEGQAILTPVNTFFQIENGSNAPAQVLYIVSPAYVFDADSSGVLYDDSVTVNEDWVDLERKKWKITSLGYKLPSEKDRKLALTRISKKKNNK